MPAFLHVTVKFELAVLRSILVDPHVCPNIGLWWPGRKQMSNAVLGQQTLVGRNMADDPVEFLQPTVEVLEGLGSPLWELNR